MNKTEDVKKSVTILDTPEKKVNDSQSSENKELTAIDSSGVNQSQSENTERPKTPQELNVEEKKEVEEAISSNVNKLEISKSQEDTGLIIESLDLDMDDLSNLEEVYTDNLAKPSTKNDSLNLSNVSERKSETSDLSLQAKSKSKLDNQNNNSIKMDIEESPPVKTIIIDTKKGTSSRASNEDDINITPEYSEDDEDSDEDSSGVKQKVYNKYSRKKNFSFFD